jgi:hypothetical protein
VRQIGCTDFYPAPLQIHLRVILKSVAGVMAPRHHDGVARCSLTDRLSAQLDEVEQDRDQDSRENVSARKGNAGRDEDSLQAVYYCEKLWHRTAPLFLPLAMVKQNLVYPHRRSAMLPPT